MKPTGNEPALPQKQSNEPRIGGIRGMITYKKGNKMPTRIINVVGVTFDGRQDIIAKMSGREAVRLQPEPLNTYDKNAVAVIATLSDGSNAHIGYISKSLAFELAPMMADGQQVVCSIRQISGGFELNDGSEKLANYGVELVVGLPEETK